MSDKWNTDGENKEEFLKPEHWITHYSYNDDDDVVDVLQGRVNYAINDMMEHMVYFCEFKPDEIKKIILRDIKSIIKSYRPRGNRNDKEDKELR